MMSPSSLSLATHQGGGSPADRDSRIRGGRPGLAALLAAAALLAQPVRAAEPPKAPLLRVEAGMHVNTVRDVAVDAGGRFAVTASDDKTARVWDIANNSAGAVLRVPIDEGTEGRLQAVVISPDGNTVGVAGNTGRSWDGSNFVYVFDRASGNLLRRIDARAQSPVVSMALSPDGRVLAVGLGGNGGLKLFDFASGAALGADAGNYQDSIYALDFTRDGRRLASGGADGRLHVYEVNAGQLKRLGGGRPEGGRLIAQARFSPDGQLIALGFEDSPQPQVLSAVDLSVVARPSVGDAPPGAFSSLAWSPDGSELWGGGAHRDRSGALWQLRVWPRSGNFASFADRPAAGASVLSITTLPRQRVLFTTAEPGWGTVDPQAQVQRRMQSPVASFNSLAKTFQISPDGQRVRYWYAYKQPLFEFDLPTRSLRPAEGGGLVAPRTEAPGLQVQGWENARGPGLNGARLPIGELETSRSLSIAADGKSFVLGTDEGLWNFDASGRPLWNRKTPALVWAVNQTPDGRLLITAGQDGAIRWYRAKDGFELMALLPHADKRRWVLWMPSGYFDAAVGSEDLLGWHVNRRSDAKPDFFPLRSLRARLYRPDVLDKLLEAMDGDTALRTANAASNRPPEAPLVLAETLPPVLEAVGATELKGSGEELRLRIRLRTQPDAPVTALTAKADGRPAQAETAGGTNAAGETDLRIRFSGQPQTITLLAENKHGRSAPASYSIEWPAAAAPSAGSTGGAAIAGATAGATAGAAATGAAATGAAANPALAATTPAAGAQPGEAGFDRKPKLYVLAIGVGKFQDAAVPPLDLTSKDVRDFVNEIKKQQGKLYRQVDVKLLVDGTATRDAIMDGLDWLQRQVTQHDVGMLFVAGHGDNDAELGYIYIPTNFNFDSKRRTAVSFKEFDKTLNALAGKAVFFIDTCHSGNVLGEKKRALARNADATGAINELISAEGGVVVFSAATGRQYALEDKAWGNGAFTKALVEGLSGKADFRGKGYVTHKMLDFYISDRVKELTKGKQTPVTQAPGGVPDFPLAMAGAMTPSEGKRSSK